MRTSHKLLTLFGQAITYLARFEFNVDAAAPLSTPYTEGLGSLTLVQTDGQFSKSGGALAFPAQATPVLGDQGFNSVGSFARQSGRALLYQTTFSALGGGVGSFAGWNKSASIALNQIDGRTLRPFNGVLYGMNSGAALIQVGVFANATAYSFADVLLTTGNELFIKGGAFTDWTLLWRGEVLGTSTPLFPAFSNFDNAGTMDYWRVRDLLSAMSTDYGIATLNVASPVDATLYTGDADVLAEITIANVTALSICGLKYRYLDANNYWIMYIDAAGAFKVDSVVAGTPTNRVNVAGVGSIGGTYTLRAIADGTKHNFYTLNASTWTKRGAEINVSTSGDAATTVVPTIGANWTPTNLRDFPRRSALYNQLSFS